MSARKTRVLIVDDSALVRQTLAELIKSEPDLDVMALANDPYAAAKHLREEVPDVIMLDVEMPRMDGITFLRRLMAQHPVPVVVCSSLVGDGSETMMAALEAGAVDIIPKPQIGTRQFLEEAKIRICDVLRAAARAKLAPARARASQAAKTNGRDQAPAARGEQQTPGDRRNGAEQPARHRPQTRGGKGKGSLGVVAIGASTGGTEALQILLQAMPADAPPIVIVQHMPERFTAAFAKRLDKICTIAVREARDGDVVEQGQALIAPGNQHMMLARAGADYVVDVRYGPLVSRHRPSVNVLFRSVARAAGPNATGVILTGMGNDGAEGLREMSEAGAMTIGQDEASCVVYGMPREAMKAGAVRHELPLEMICGAILSGG